MEDFIPETLPEQKIELTPNPGLSVDKLEGSFQVRDGAKYKVVQLTRSGSSGTGTYSAVIGFNPTMIRIQAGGLTAGREWSDCTAFKGADESWNKGFGLARHGGSGNVDSQTSRIIRLVNSTGSNQDAEMIDVINGTLKLNFTASTSGYNIRMTITCYK